jgi:two-component system chemotaxis response regulator CheY
MKALSQYKDCTVMVVDDSPFMRETLRVMLETSGYTVVAEASDGIEAVEKYLKMFPQITIMDIMMPKKDGINATKDIVSFYKNARIVLCSTLGIEVMTKAALAAGAMGVISKPYIIEEINTVINKVMQF